MGLCYQGSNKYSNKKKKKHISDIKVGSLLVLALHRSYELWQLTILASAAAIRLRTFIIFVGAIGLKLLNFIKKIISF